ncbi:unnamed protein product [Sympodiomycopsis kandeliae]
MKPFTATLFLAFWTCLTAVTAVRATQAPFLAGSYGSSNQHPHDSDASDHQQSPVVLATSDKFATPLDVLIASPHHRILTRLLQRTRLIPTLLRLIEFDDGSGLTIVAPTDDALHAQASSEDGGSGKGIWSRSIKLLQDSDRTLTWGLDSKDIAAPQADNIQEEVRQQLLHHILNFTLPYATITNLTGDKTIDIPDLVTSSRSHRPLPLTIPHMHSTLHFPSRRILREPSRPGPIPQPPQGPTHPGDEGDGGLLGGEGQKVRMIWRWADDDKQGGDSQASFNESRGSIWLGVDAKGRGGVQALQERRTPHGIVISVDGVLPLPPLFATVVRTHPALATLSDILDDEILHTLSVTAHSTFFLPSGASFDKVPDLAASYLLRNISLEEQREAWTVVEWDRTKLIGWHVTGRGLVDENGQWGQVAYSERLRGATDDQGQGSLTTILGGPLHFSYNASDPNRGLRVGEHKIVEEDILVENGVIHITNSLLLPYPSALALNVEKTLLALNASRFVNMMKKAGLEHYLLVGSEEQDDTLPRDSGEDQDQRWTFIVPSDETLHDWFTENPDVARWWRRIEDGELNSDGSATGIAMLDEASQTKKPTLSVLKNLLKYHIVPDNIMPHNLTDGGLVATELRNWRLKDGRQRIVTTVSEPRGKTSKDREGNGDVAFGDANVIADPVIVEGSNSSAIIYLVSKLLAPPDNPIQTAVGASLDLSTFVAAVFSAELDKPIKKAPGVTYLVPNNAAFSSLGLVMPYLLLPNEQSRSELRRVVEYHAIDQIVYVEDFASGERRYPTLEGSSIWAGKDKNGTIEVRRQSHLDGDGKLADDRASGRPAKIRAKDLLTSTGVLHEIDQVELPKDLDLTSGKLLKGAKCDTFRDLVIKAGYGFILNGTTPDEDDLLLSFKEDHAGSLKNGKKKRDKKHKRRRRLFDDNSQSYILLAPTDAAFAKINLTYYLTDKEALKKLVQLHILPSPPAEDEENIKFADLHVNGEQKRLPLGLRDGWSLPSLLDKSLGGQSAYGKIAFRDVGLRSSGLKTRTQEDAEDEDDDDRHEEGDLGWMLGISGSRGASSVVADEKTMEKNRRKDRHSARALNFGRESLAVRKSNFSLRQKTSDDDKVSQRRSIGGVLTIDSVLLPYEPNWFHRWGWIVLTVLFGLFKGSIFSFAIYKWWKGSYSKKKRDNDMGEAMAGEEE